jgi:hypothetical protein
VRGERGLPSVPVEGVDPFRPFGRRQDQLVATEELDERSPVLPHPIPALLDLLRVAEDQFRLRRRKLERDPRSRPAIVATVGSASRTRSVGEGSRQPLLRDVTMQGRW